MRIKPIFDRVLLEIEKKPKSSLLMPNSESDLPMVARVVAVGEGTKDNPMVVAVGDRVLFDKYAASEVSVDDKSYLMVCVSDILAILEA